MAGRMAPPRRGRPYYDADRGLSMILPRAGGKAIPYVGGDGPPKFDPARALRRSGTTARQLGRELGRDAERGAGALAERQPFNVGAFGGFLVTAAAALVGLLVLELWLREPKATETLLGGFGRGIRALVDPNDPLFAAGPKEANDSDPGGSGDGGSGGGGGAASARSPAPQLQGAGGRFFPVAGAADFTDSFNAPRSPDSTGGTGVHGAIDIFAKKGTPIVALEGGVLDRVGFNTYGGNRLHVLGAFDAYYAHLDRYAPGIRDGARVEAGQLLGYVGDTGSAKGTPPHLHFALEDRGGGLLNPVALLRSLWQKTTTTHKKGVLA